MGLALPWLLLGVFTIYLSVGSASVAEYVLVPQQPRYLLPVFALGCVAVGVEFTSWQARERFRLSTRVISGLGLVVISLWATKETGVRSTPAVVQWLENLEAPLRSEVVVSDDFIMRQALEYRERVAALDLQSFSATAPDSLLMERLGSRALLAVASELDEGFRELGASLAEISGRRYRVEEIRAPAWPPYKRSLGLGRDHEVAGWVWWPGDSG
jgi:hypothetical protein